MPLKENTYIVPHLKALISNKKYRGGNYLPAAGRQIPKITHIEGAVTFHMNLSEIFSQSEASKNMTYRR